MSKDTTAPDVAVAQPHPAPRAEPARLLARAIEAVSSAPTPDAALDALLQQVADAFGAERALVLLGDAKDGPAPPQVMRAQGAAIATGQWHRAPDPTAGPLWLDDLPRPARLESTGEDLLATARAALSHPFALRSGRRGALVCLHGRPGAFSDADPTDFAPLALLAAQVAETAQLAEEAGRARDVLDRSEASVKQAEAERAEAQDRLVTALSSTSEAFLLIDADARIVFANPRYGALFGADGVGGGFAPGERFTDVWARRLRRLGADADEAARDAADKLRSLRAGCVDQEQEMPDGRVLLVNCRSTLDAGVVSTATEITNLKATERLLLQRAGAIDAAEDGIAITDTEGRLVYANPSHLAMFGYTAPHQVLGSHWTALFRPDQAAQLERRAMPELARMGRWRGEVTGLTRAGREVTQELSLTRLPEIGLVCVARDISVRLRDERERARLREQLMVAQRQEAVGHLAAGVAHDFNNVLSAITGSAILVKNGLDAGSELHAHVDRIVSSGESAAQLTARLLDLGARQSERRMLDLGAAIREATQLLRPGVPAGIEIALDLPETPIAAEADPTDILQLILNLGINARDAIGEATGAIRLALETWDGTDPPGRPCLGRPRPERRYACIVVADSGTGISPEEIDRIFQPYFTTKGPSGTGLGLAVVSSIVQTARGAITLASAPGQGTEFRVYWPLGAPARLPSPGRALEIDKKMLEDTRILVVEDVAAVAQVITASLERAGAEVTACPDAPSALTAIDARRALGGAPFDLVITDYDMPGLSGAELALRVRDRDATVPILLCTALPAEVRRSALGTDPFDAVLAKPVRPATLIGAANATLRRGRVQPPAG